MRFKTTGLKKTKKQKTTGLFSSASEQYLPGLKHCTNTGPPSTPQSFKHWDSPGTITQGQSRWKTWQPQSVWPDLANAGETCPSLSRLSSSLYCCKHNPLLSCKGTYKPTAGIRTCSSLGTITVPTTCSSFFRAHLLYLLCFCQSPSRVQREW